MRWTDSLEEEVFERLVNCRTIKADLKPLVDARWRFLQESGKAAAKNLEKEDAVVDILELLDCNSQDFGCYLVEEEYKLLCK